MPRAFAVLESLRPTFTGTVGPPGQVLMAWAAANWMRSAVPTFFSLAMLARLLQICSRPRFSLLEHSLARMREPSQAPLKQSWNALRIAARAASVHWPSARNCAVRVVEISFQTEGQAAGAFLGITDLAQSRRFWMERLGSGLGLAAACAVVLAANEARNRVVMYILYRVGCQHNTAQQEEMEKKTRIEMQLVEGRRTAGRW